MLLVLDRIHIPDVAHIGSTSRGSWRSVSSASPSTSASRIISSISSSVNASPEPGHARRREDANRTESSTGFVFETHGFWEPTKEVQTPERAGSGHRQKRWGLRYRRSGSVRYRTCFSILGMGPASFIFSLPCPPSSQQTVCSSLGITNWIEPVNFHIVEFTNSKAKTVPLMINRTSFVLFQRKILPHARLPGIKRL